MADEHRSATPTRPQPADNVMGTLLYRIEGWLGQASAVPGQVDGPHVVSGRKSLHLPAPDGAAISGTVEEDEVHSVETSKLPGFYSSAPGHRACGGFMGS
jgi:hypothetical protein